MLPAAMRFYLHHHEAVPPQSHIGSSHHTSQFDAAPDEIPATGSHDQTKNDTSTQSTGLQPSIAKPPTENGGGGAPLSTSPSTASTASTSSSASTSTDNAVRDSGGGGNARLSNGAIAGIAVGASLAIILLLAGLALLLLRRRRQKQRDAARAEGGLASKPTVEDKDLHAEHMAESPRSPYSDDGPSLQSQTSPVSPLPPASHGEEADVAALPSSHSGVGAGAGAGAGELDHDHGHGHDRDDHSQTQRDVPNTVAHLVEEGMTDDEIRRLEDEERQLDAEIERAARR